MLSSFISLAERAYAFRSVFRIKSCYVTEHCFETDLCNGDTCFPEGRKRFFGDILANFKIQTVKSGWFNFLLPSGQEQFSIWPLGKNMPIYSTGVFATSIIE
jgi:hypothetical protein